MIEKAYLQTFKGEFATEATYVAFLGCEHLRIKTEKFDYDEIDSLDITKNTIVFGGVTPIRHALSSIGVIVPEPIDIPEELYKYTMRDIEIGTVRHFKDNGKFPLFVKPTTLKLFTGLVIPDRDELDYISTLTMQGDELNIMTSSVVNFVSEYRVFVAEGKVIDCRKYVGNHEVTPNFSFINDTIKNYTSQPIAYAIDFGVIDKGETMLIEVNDGYGIGTYGLDGREYVRMSILRWNELCKNIER